MTAISIPVSNEPLFEVRSRVLPTPRPIFRFQSSPSFTSREGAMKCFKLIRPSFSVALFVILLYLAFSFIFETSDSHIEKSLSSPDFMRLEAKVDALSSSAAFLSHQIQESHSLLQTLILADRQEIQESINQLKTDQQKIVSTLIVELSTVLDQKLQDQETQNPSIINLHTAKTSEDVSASVKSGSDIEELNDRDETPLISAIKNGNLQVFHALLDLGADPNSSFRGTMRPIHWAAFRGEGEMIEELEKKGVDINDLFQRETPLMIAAEEENIKAVETLLKLKANTEIKDNRGWTPLMSASAGGNVDLVDLLLFSKANTNAQSSSQQSSLSLAALNDHLEIMNILASHGAHLDHKDSSGLTILMRAVSEGKIKTVDRLLGLGCDLNLLNREGKTALMIASEKNETEIVQLLLAHGSGSQIAVKEDLDFSQSQETKDTVEGDLDFSFSIAVSVNVGASSGLWEPLPNLFDFLKSFLFPLSKKP